MPRDALTPGKAREQLDTARREAREAATLGEELRERVRSGEDITAAQLAAQDQLAELAQLRITAAERKLAEAQKADLDARATAIRDDVRDLIDEDSTAAIVTAARGVMTAVAALVSASATREAAIREVATAAESMNAELGWTPGNMPATDRYGFRGQASTLPISAMSLGEGRVVAVPVGEVLGAALSAVLVGQSEERHRAREILGFPGENTKRVLEGVPGLADALRFTAEEWQALDQRARYEASQQGRRPLPEGVEG